MDIFKFSKSFFPIVSDFEAYILSALSCIGTILRCLVILPYNFTMFQSASGKVVGNYLPLKPVLTSLFNIQKRLSSFK